MTGVLHCKTCNAASPFMLDCIFTLHAGLHLQFPVKYMQMVP